MLGLQGKKTPARVQLFLIVNPPSWFGSIWKIMKPMLSKEFRRKVHTIKVEKMKDSLAPVDLKNFCLMTSSAQDNRIPHLLWMNSFENE
jgi:hypothetical protein